MQCLPNMHRNDYHLHVQLFREDFLEVEALITAFGRNKA